MGSHDDVRIQHIYHAELSSFSGLTASILLQLSPLGTGLKIPPPQEPDCCIPSHSRTVIPTSSLI